MLQIYPQWSSKRTSHYYFYHTQERISCEISYDPCTQNPSKQQNHQSQQTIQPLLIPFNPSTKQLHGEEETFNPSLTLLKHKVVQYEMINLLLHRLQLMMGQANQLTIKAIT